MIDLVTKTVVSTMFLHTFEHFRQFSRRKNNVATRFVFGDVLNVIVTVSKSEQRTRSLCFSLVIIFHLRVVRYEHRMRRRRCFHRVEAAQLRTSATRRRWRKKRLYYLAAMRTRERGCWQWVTRWKPRGAQTNGEACREAGLWFAL